MDYIWFIPLLPAAGVLINGVVGIRYFSRRVSGCSPARRWRHPSSSRSTHFTLLAWPPNACSRPRRFTGFRRSRSKPCRSQALCPWLLRIDPLSATMILIVTGIGLLIHIYSTA